MPNPAAMVTIKACANLKIRGWLRLSIGFMSNASKIKKVATKLSWKPGEASCCGSKSKIKNAAAKRALKAVFLRCNIIAPDIKVVIMAARMAAVGQPVSAT